jgi:uncharacterized protein YdeI (BOF family)
VFKLRRRFTPSVIALNAIALSVAIGFNACAALNERRAAAYAAPKVVSIAEARAMPSGTPVTLEGSVSVPSGAFKSGTSDEGFAIQDKTGGIYVRTDVNLKLRIRQRVRVVGKLADSFGMLVVVPAGASDVQARGRGMKIPEESVPTGGIGETTEGRLMQITGTITKPVGNDLPYGYRLFINDGSGEVQAFIYVSTGVDVRGLQPGQRIGVTGFSGQYNDHYEIIPRFQSDIRTLR